jgi:hypothetical protein
MLRNSINFYCRKVQFGLQAKPMHNTTDPIRLRLRLSDLNNTSVTKSKGSHH